MKWPSDPPLHVAAAHGRMDEIQRLLDEGADINSKGETWGTVLNAARILGNYEIVALLLRHGAEDDDSAEGGLFEVPEAHEHKAEEIPDSGRPQKSTPFKLPGFMGRDGRHRCQISQSS